ncbi:QueT transporter family protein [Massiliimalia timonensis]|uniref:QueT transporter family protein n=1 Tax=Massiliimalia timonensis TaxID=1987501 RepID=UPI000B8A8DD6|nr:QueT transporter family protein [Massiliimalia timonensis]
MEHTEKRVMKLVKVSMIAAIYVALTLAVAPFAYGPVQFRVSEAMTVLPAFTTMAIPGLSLGCCLANLIGLFLGNPLGLVDAVFGTLATLLAAVISWKIGRCKSRTVRYLLVPLPPVVANAVIVGAELTVVLNEGADFGKAYPLNALSVGIGEAVICYTLGILLMVVLQKNDFYKKIF